MNKSKIFLILLFIPVLTLFSYRVTFPFFSNQANSTSNIFAAASTFPTSTPSSTPTPSPTPTPLPINPGDVVINEINWAGSEGHGSDEWIELRNTTSNTIDLSNWVIVNLGTGPTPNIIIPSGNSIAASGLFLLSNFSNTSSSSHLNVAPNLVTTGVSLSDLGEQLLLKTSTISGVIIDTANGLSSWYAGSTSTPKSSMERNDIPGDGTISTNWHTATTTVNLDPGATESATPKAIND